MLLCDHQIRALCGDRKDGTLPMISPFSEGVSGDGQVSWGLTHAGYDLRLGNEVWVFKNTYGEIVDPKAFRTEGYAERVMDKLTIGEGQCLYIAAHSYLLARSLEYLRMPRYLKGRVVGKSTLARCGILINCTPIEPMWHGVLVLEIGNTSPSTIRLYPGEGVAQLEFELLYDKPEKDYGQKEGIYQGQQGITPARVL